MKQTILFFIESLSGGGAEQVLVTLLRNFNFERYDVTLLTVSDIGVHRNDIDYKKVHYRFLIPRKQNAFYSIWYKIKYKLIYRYLPAWLVSRIIIPSGFNTYIAFTEGYCTKIISKLSPKINKISYVHIDLQSLPWTLTEKIYKTLDEEKEAFRRFNKVVCVSHSVERVMQTYYSLNNTTTIYNPIDVMSINAMAQQQINFKVSDGFNLVSVGRLVPQKGYDLLIPIVARLIDDGMNVSLYILGEGEERPRLEKQIEDLKLQAAVHLLGYQKNPYAFLRKMDLFVCSSRAEGFSLVIGEALSLGIPVISTNCSGPNELLDGNKYGVLCENHKQIYQRLKEIIPNSDVYTELCHKAQMRKNLFDISSSMNQLYDII